MKKLGWVVYQKLVMCNNNKSYVKHGDLKI